VELTQIAKMHIIIARAPGIQQARSNLELTAVVDGSLARTLSRILLVVVRENVFVFLFSSFRFS
jgi:hypothetical protein